MWLLPVVNRNINTQACTYNHCLFSLTHPSSSKIKPQGYRVYVLQLELKQSERFFRVVCEQFCVSAYLRYCFENMTHAHMYEYEISFVIYITLKSVLSFNMQTREEATKLALN